MQPPSASLQAWHSGDQRNSGRYGKAQISTFPPGILVVAAQETKLSGEGEILNNCKQKIDIKYCWELEVFFGT